MNDLQFNLDDYLSNHGLIEASKLMEKRCAYYIIYILSGIFVQLFAQQTGQLAAFPVQLDSVIIFGNEKTHSEVILRELPFQLPAQVDSESIQRFENRLNNLLLFNRVMMTVIPQGPRNYLVIEVTEKWYIYPVPLIFINDRDWNKISYGFQLRYENFRGMNERLNFGGWVGHNPSFFLRYSNPWVGYRSRLIFGINLFRNNMINRIADFKEKHIGGSITLGKRLSYHTSISSFLALRHIKFPKKYRQHLFSNRSISDPDRMHPADLIPKIGIHYRNDHRDLFEYPRQGHLIRWTVIRNGFTSRQPQFWRFDLDHRLYLKLSDRFSIGGRNLLRLNKGTLPVYDQVYIGFSERIRGNFRKVFTDQNLMLQNYELRISLLPIRYYSWDESPFFSQFFQQLKYGLSMGFFVDSGIAWKQFKAIWTQKHLTGFGVGLHIHLPYIYLLRIENAWNRHFDNEWIIEAGVSF